MVELAVIDDTGNVLLEESGVVNFERLMSLIDEEVRIKKGYVLFGIIGCSGILKSTNRRYFNKLEGYHMTLCDAYGVALGIHKIAEITQYAEREHKGVALSDA